MNTFESLGLSAQITKTLSLLGYESPTPIQAEAIPVFLQGGDIIAQAQTGTGKTAAFALPIVEKIDLTATKPQALIIAPTRELAIQVAEALKSYAKHIPSFHVLPIYGGQEYRGQLASLKRGVHVVVGTPGRIMDHMRRGTLQLDDLKTLVLDEADEMLKMGFIDDIEWILEHVPKQRQIALFSATMPPAIQKVANNYLLNATKIQIASKTKTVTLIDQGCVFVTQYNKLEALTRFLETETFDAIMIFARTKIATTELAEKLAARGYSVDALNGDVRQSMREKVIYRLKNKTLDIVVATEVAARGLDVDRIDLVINYDIPTDPESYVHRVGRTGRAGRSGKALTFVTPRERGLLSAIERTINIRIEQIQIPSLKQMHEKRVGNLSKKILEVLAKENLSIHRELIERIAQESEYNALDIAAALAFMSQGDALSQPETHDELSQPINVDRDRDYGSQGRERRREYSGRSGSGDRDRNRSSRPAGGERERSSYSRSSDNRPSEGERRERSSARPSEEKARPPSTRTPFKRFDDSKEGAAPRKRRVFDRKAPAGAVRKPRDK
ncbi:MAG: DEAD/DEAH box helicase [Gammaproteobacteria bacterium]|nr:DEAD/DEAH box helicase [Gammaproteobacteria bacterium]